LGKACEQRDAPVRLAISAERDKYPKQHLGLGGIAWVYLREPGDAQRVTDAIKTLAGVEQVLTRAEAAKAFDLLPERIGDLAVTGDRDTVFGTLEQESEMMAATYRSHGSRYETAVPLIIRDETRKLEAALYQQNRDLTWGLLR